MAPDKRKQVRSILVTLLTLLTLLTLFPSPITSWGNLGHRVIAYLAEKHLTPLGHAYIQQLLRDRDISDAAIWADFYKNTPPGWHTSSWHFLNAHDDPPNSCGLEMEQDCPKKEMCIITAISDMTKKLTNTNLALSFQTKALKFLLHLIGDLHNPLHIESLAKGGNDIEVLFDGQRTNLHFLWDFEILLKHTQSTKANEIKAAKEWAEKLFAGKTVRNKGVEDGFLTISEGISKLQVEELVLTWARETNRWVCDYVLKDGVEAIRGKELEGEYYEGAVPIIEELIGKAGWRLAGWINALAEQELALGFSEDGAREL